MYRISNEPLVRRFLRDDEPVSRANIVEVMARNTRMSSGGVGPFGVLLRRGEEFVGFCGFLRDPGGSGEIEHAYELLLWL